MGKSFLKNENKSWVILKGSNYLKMYPKAEPNLDNIDNVGMALIWNLNIGISQLTTKCLTGCGKTITRFSFRVVRINYHAENTLDNLAPVCKKCKENISSSCTNLDDYISSQGYWPVQRGRLTVRSVQRIASE